MKHLPRGARPWFLPVVLPRLPYVGDSGASEKRFRRPPHPPERAMFGAYAACVVLAVGLAFWWPGFRAAGGRFPVPLDDVYIHFGFARSAALANPFE